MKTKLFTATLVVCSLFIANGLRGQQWYGSSTYTSGQVERAGKVLLNSPNSGEHLEIRRGTYGGVFNVDNNGLSLDLFGTNASFALTGGRMGIGTATPGTLLDIKAPWATMRLDKSPGGEAAFMFSKSGTEMFYFFSDNGDNDALKIMANISGESDPSPRMEFPLLNKNIYMVESGGKVGIGSTNPDEKLTVNGSIHTLEVRVDVSVPGPDYVFNADYNLLPLTDLEKYIQQHKHLPEIPSAKEMERDGLKLMEMNILLLKKVEELTLHIIDLNNRIKVLEEK